MKNMEPGLEEREIRADSLIKSVCKRIVPLPILKRIGMARSALKDAIHQVDSGVKLYAFLSQDAFRYGGDRTCLRAVAKPVQ